MERFESPGGCPLEARLFGQMPQDVVLPHYFPPLTIPSLCPQWGSSPQMVVGQRAEHCPREFACLEQVSVLL